MVNIRRPARRQAKGSVFSIRNVILLLVSLQGLNIIRQSLTATKTTESSPSSPLSGAKSLADHRLSDSEIKGAGGGNNYNNDYNSGRMLPRVKGVVKSKMNAKTGQDDGDVNAVDNSQDNHRFSNGSEDERHEQLRHIKTHDGDNPQGEPDIPEIPSHEAKVKQQELQKKQGQKPLGDTVQDKSHKEILSRIGTGATKTGYLKDFVYERENPSFRKGKVDMDSDSTRALKVASKLDDGTRLATVFPCVISLHNPSERSIDEKCVNGDVTLIAYNTAEFERVWCGSIIAPGSVIKFDSHCVEPSAHLFLTLPTTSGQGLPATIIKSHSDAVHKSDLETVMCDILCQQEKGMEGPDRYIDGVEEWRIIQTMDDPNQFPLARIERLDYRFDKYFATQSFQSSIPTPQFSFEKHNLRNRPALSWDGTENKAFYLVNTNCAAQATKRLKYLHSIAALIPVDSYGVCQHSIDPPLGSAIETLEGRLAIMKKYRFVLALDSISEKDYISDVVWEAFISGSVPVVLGADNAASDHFPPHSAIFASEFGGVWDDMAAYVKKVSENRSLWESYHVWRTDKKAIAAFEQKYSFTRTSPECRMCKWAYAKRYGLGWNHTTQDIQDVKLKRHLCLTDDHQLVTKPFREQWTDDTNAIMTAPSAAPESCTSKVSETTVEVGQHQIHRRIVQHDGVTDVLITGVDGPEGELEFQLQFPTVHNLEGAFFRNPHTIVPTVLGPFATSIAIVDRTNKVTVLADWPTAMTCTSEGKIDVKVSMGGTYRRLRVITEDIGALHDKPTEFFPSNFMKRMTQDFIDPLEVYYSNSGDHKT